MPYKILVTSTDLMMIQFLVPHVINLVEHGYQIEVACSNVGGRIEDVRNSLIEYVSKIHVVNLHRNPARLENLSGFREMKIIIDSGCFDLVWTNEPVMGVVTRLAARSARKHGTKVLYMVHGFHFYEGAPLLYWALFYPVERFFARWTDVICTVNKEDYFRAKSFKPSQIEYIHGIGINEERLAPSSNRYSIREELNLPDNSLLILSVGELNINKNHKAAIKSFSKIRVNNSFFLLCGKGDQQQTLERIAEYLGIRNRIFFLGYRKDVVDICSQVDVFIMPSKREGLPVATLEAMYCSLPVVSSNIRGLKDIMIGPQEHYMCSPNNIEMFARNIEVLLLDSNERRFLGACNQDTVKPYCLKQVKKEILSLIDMIFEDDCNA